MEKLQAALSARESALRGSEHELADLKNKLQDMNRSVHTKEKIIEAMQVGLCCLNSFVISVARP